MTAHRPVLELDGIGRSFGDMVVLKSAGMTALPGRITALLGRNGAGKTTLMRVAVGAVAADYGRVLFQGEWQPRPRLARLARQGLMYSAQESALTPLFTVDEHFRAYLEVHGGWERHAEVVEQLRLGEFGGRHPRELSGGERQRVSLALALLRAPTCLLMDEPFAGVAPLDLPLVIDGLRTLRTRGTALIVSGHDVEALFQLADEVVWVAAGTTHVLGAPADALRHHQFVREYLGPGRRIVAPE